MQIPYRVLPIVVLIVLLLNACQPVLPPTPAPTATPLPPTPTPQVAFPPPETILFVGNSAVSSGLVDQHLEKMAAFSEPSLILDTRTSILGGGSLNMHWDTELALMEIQKGGWDVVVLQEDSGVISDRDAESFYEYTRRFDQEIKNIGAQTVLYMDWEYPKGNWNDTDGIVAAHRYIADELGAKVAPVGLAWKRAVEQRPDLNLYDYDNVHPNNLGTYLIVNVLFATLFEQSPVRHHYRLAYIVPDPDSVAPANKTAAQELRDKYFISEGDAEFLQRVAWETVQEYRAMP